MIVSDARREANRRNATRSTGPKTDQGKEAVRRNALKHGLTALVVAGEDEAAAARERVAGLHEILRPQNAWQVWVAGEVAKVSVKLDRLAEVERQVRARGCWRALSCWEDDQREKVERVAARLGRDPSRIVGLLGRSPQGCDWMIERWAILANVADRHPWTDEQKRLAYDLLGTPEEGREDAPGRIIDANGLVIGPDRSEAEVARGMLADLKARREHVADADEIARSLAQADLDDLGNRDLVRLRRYERDLRAQLRYYYDLGRSEAPPVAADLGCKPGLARLADRFPGETAAPPVAAEVAVEPRDAKPLAAGGGERNKAIMPAPGAEKQLVDTDLCSPEPVPIPPLRPVTAYEQWAWEKNESDHALWLQCSGVRERSSTLPISAGKR